MIINGEEKNFSAATVQELLKELGYLDERVVVEVNLQIVPKEQWSTHQLSDADRLEIVSFVGGG